MDLKTLMGALSTQTLGFSFGTPWRPGDDAITCVVPILRELKDAEERGYVTFEEAGDKLEIIDSGRINQATVANTGELPIFMRMGTLLKGDTQERSLTISRIIMPGVKTDIDIVCIHASKEIVGGARFRADGYTPGKDTLFARTAYVSKSGGGVNQGASWRHDKMYYENTVRSFAGGGTGTLVSDMARAAASLNFAQVSADNMTETHQKVLDAFKDIAKDMPLFPNQIGFGLIDMNGFHSLDCFDLPDSWQAVKEAITGKEALKITEKDNSGVFKYDPDKAADVMKDATGQGYESETVFEDSNTKTIAFDTSDHIGEATMLGDKVIHLLMSRKDKKK